jgi:hypothetical protein
MAPQRGEDETHLASQGKCQLVHGSFGSGVNRHRVKSKLGSDTSDVDDARERGHVLVSLLEQKYRANDRNVKRLADILRFALKNRT